MYLEDLVGRSVERLRTFCPPEGYWLAFSGGKDSQCIYHLALEAQVPFEAHYNATTVDPPELVRFIRYAYPSVQIDRPVSTMWECIIHHKFPPTMLYRYCCEALKERGGRGRVTVTGVRWAESTRRKHTRGVVELNSRLLRGTAYHSDNDITRRMVESCPIKSKHVVNPIIDWADKDVWEYLNSRHLPHCLLYDEGRSRIGCVGCPQAPTRTRVADLERWPHFYRLYLRTFDSMLQARQSSLLRTTWASAEEVMDWWLFGLNKKYPKKEVS